MNFKDKIAEIIAKTIIIEKEEIINTIEIPPNNEMGDFAYPCFKLAKIMRKSPQMIAENLANTINSELPEIINKVKEEGGYVNFFINKKIYATEVITEILQKGQQYGKSETGKNQNIVIDYSSPNIAKPFHVGHLRSTVIGNALYNIFKTLGYNCIGINHLGDWGTQFGKLIVAYKQWGVKEKVDEKGIEELNRLYVKFHEHAKSNTQLEDDARAYFVKMQIGDTEALQLWKWFYDISMKDFQRVYEMLNVKFDAYTGESFYNDKMDKVVEELNEKQLLQESDGAMIVDLEEYKMPPCLIIRKDGGTLYATRDIAAVLYRKNKYNFDKCIYVTALDQNLHFAQWFKVVEKMGYNWCVNLTHVPFGLVSLETGKLSTRQGNVVLMEDLLNEAITKTLQIINDKNPNLQNKEQIAKEVGIGAIIFNDLYNNRIKDVVFSWDRMLNFDGETGPYVQYTYARASSVLRKSKIENIKIDDINFSVLSDTLSIDVCKLLQGYPQKIKEAAEKLEPSIITRTLVDIAQAFNKFYHETTILVEDYETRISRLALVTCVKTLLSMGLSILGIKTPEQM